ncbi:SIS domain-containing protein [Microbacterium sp. NEAU-LLC]|uniref:SIS domain-containing protein n=1 Tax=Microbacterium helvum TaxID=2773713 RepID=A0ABR8NLS5_9MICO|nr:SIS domain-containing protein [Microbacterium helvum]MBD3941402.1 SIS domain-containing protein [Microbacterium helvum]
MHDVSTPDDPGRRYLACVVDLVQEVLDTQWDVITEAARVVAAAMGGRREIHAFGSGHSHMLAEELYYRAGGLADVRPILFEGLMLHANASLSTRLERLPGLAREILDAHGVATGDVLFVFSNSGRNQVTTELAAEAGVRGLTVIAVTSVTHSQATTPRGGGRRLLELADIVIDNRGALGDAAVEVPGFARRVAPTSTAVGAAIVNAVVAQSVGFAVAAGIEPRVYASSNVDTGDAINDAILGRS